MKTFQCIVKIGHQGAGKFTEKAFLVSAQNITEAYAKAKFLPGVKKGKSYSSGASIIQLKPLLPDLSNKNNI